MNKGAICGGVISLSMAKKDTEGAYLMAFVLPDKQYVRYIALKKQNKEKEAHKLFEKYARSQI